MTDIADGFGVAIEGTMAANAVEPGAGSSPAKGLSETSCANCEAALTGPFCQQCGQKAHTHRTLSAIGHDLVHGVLHLDGKLSHTLPLLVFKPGRLTRRYIEGERAKFVSPMSMFLFGVFAMFAVFQMVGLTTPTDLDFGGPGDAVRAEGEAELERLDEQIKAMAPGDPELEERKLQRDLLEGLVTGGIAGVANEAATETQEAEASDEAGGEAGEGDQNATLGETLELGWEEASPDEKLTGVAFVDNAIRKWEKNPGLMLYKMQANGYKFSWLLIPLSLPFVWALFLWRREFKAYDHTIFITYSLSFMSLLFIALSLAAAAGLTGGLVVLAFMAIAPLHLYKHLKYSYGLSRFATLWRFNLLSFSMLFIVMLFANTLLLLGAF